MISLEKRVYILKLSKRLKELEVRQESYREWSEADARARMLQTPPDSVLKCQTIDVTEVIFSLCWRRNLVQPRDRNW